VGLYRIASTVYNAAITLGKEPTASMAGAIADTKLATQRSEPSSTRALVIWVVASVVAELLLVCDWMRAYLEQAAGHWGDVSSLDTWVIGELGGLVFGLGGWLALRAYGSVRWQWLAASGMGWMLAAVLSSVARPAGLNDPQD
jgi:hypothetical protein